VILTDTDSALSESQTDFKGKIIKYLFLQLDIHGLEGPESLFSDGRLLLWILRGVATIFERRSDLKDPDNLLLELVLYQGFLSTLQS
jgi:hypothetical protein